MLSFLWKEEKKGERYLQMRVWYDIINLLFDFIPEPLIFQGLFLYIRFGKGTDCGVDFLQEI